MPNIKSAVKRVKVSKAKTLKNKIFKSSLKTSIKKCAGAIANKEDGAVELFRNAIKAIDKAVAKNIVHKNTASRKKSKLMKALNALSAHK